MRAQRGDQRLGWVIVIVVPPLVKIAHSNLTPIELELAHFVRRGKC